MGMKCRVAVHLLRSVFVTTRGPRLFHPTLNSSAHAEFRLLNTDCPSVIARTMECSHQSIGSGANKFGESVRIFSPTVWWSAMSKRKGLERLFDGRHFDREIIIFCVRWHLRYKLK
jgi:hypothetical protein